MEFEPIRVKEKSITPYAQTCWEVQYRGWSQRALKAEYIRLSAVIANQEFDSEDRKCMKYILKIRGENLSDESVSYHISTLKQSQHRCVELQILQPYLLQNEIL